LALSNWRRRQSVVVAPARARLRRRDVEEALADLGADGSVARDLDRAVEAEMARVTALSSLTSALAVDYMDRLARPIPSLTPEIGVQLVGRAYVGHLLVEGDPGRFGALDVPVVGTFPPLRKGRPPQDLLSRVVKVSRGRTFLPVCALSPAAWRGFVLCLAARAHRLTPADADPVAVEVVDGVARFAWVLRQVDIHYRQEPERT
jgi:hypothetical protein